MPKYMTLSQVEEAGRFAFRFVPGEDPASTSAVIWNGRHFVYREHLFGDPREYPDERDVEMTLGEIENRWGREMRYEWRHHSGCDCGCCGE